MNHQRHMSRRYAILGLAIAGLLPLAAGACSSSPTPSNMPASIKAVGNLSAPIEGCPITTTTPSDAGMAGDVGVDAALDAGSTDAADVGADTTADVGADTSTDVGADTSTDAGVDVASDAGADASLDAGVADASMDTGADASLDAGMDASTDAGADVGVDASMDTGTPPDASTDTGTDTGAPAPVSTTTLARVGNALSVPYLISDIEGDDQRIDVEVCNWDGQQATDCGAAVQAPGGDGTNFVPTTPAGTCVLHVFYWNVGCGRFVRASNNAQAPQQSSVDSVDQQLVVQVSVAGTKEAPVESAPFTLKDVGFDVLPACE